MGGGKGSAAPSMDMSAYNNSMNQMNQQMQTMQTQMQSMLEEDWKPEVPTIETPEFTAAEEVDWGAVEEEITGDQQDAYKDAQESRISRSKTILTDSLLDDEEATTTSSVLG